jgi:hypothetical protein
VGHPARAPIWPCAGLRARRSWQHSIPPRNCATRSPCRTLRRGSARPLVA